MKRKIATIREHATERLQLGVIGALGILIAVFGLLGNVSFQSGKLKSVNVKSIDTLWSFKDEPRVIQPPPPQKVALIDIARKGDKVSDSLPPMQPDSLEFIPGRNTIKLTLDSIKFIPREAKYPVPIGGIDVKYPDHLRMRGIQGTVVITAGLDEQGNVFDALVLKSSGNATLDTMALRAVLKARFTPAMQGDKAFAVKINVPIMFQLDR